MPKFINSYKGYTSIGIVSLAVAISGTFYIKNTINDNKAEEMLSSIIGQRTNALVQPEKIEEEHTGKRVVVNLNSMQLYLLDGTTTVSTFPLVSIGKPGSYYETIGGYYLNDYSEPSHFSSIGHVFMPWSMHVFGNFFIHGIPYHEDGTRVSSTYSGGCVRMADDDAKIVYDFISRKTPIIITRGSEDDFKPTTINTPSVESMEMTRLMIASISLEFLTQDNEILDTDGISTTTRRILIPRLLHGDDEVSDLYASYLGEKLFVQEMNAKAKALGLTNTTFTDLKKPVQTTPEDLSRFMDHINIYGSYLNKINQ